MDEPRQDESPIDASPTIGDREILGRYRALQLISIAMIAIGILLSVVVLALNRNILTSGLDPDAVERLLVPALLIALGGMLLFVGVVMNVVRALIVRAALPPERYRGPAVVALLFLAVILGTVVSLAATDTAVALVGDGPLSVPGTLLLLTSTQIGLLVITGGLVVLPRTLAGLRLAPAGRVWKTMALGLALAVPAWVGATVLAYLAGLLFDVVGLRPDNTILDSFLNRADPTVLLVALVVVAPVAEELFFRGVVYNAWERERGATVATLGSAGLFALIHGSVYALAPIFALGLVLALVYRSTRSLPATMALHAGFNAISVVIALLARAGVLSPPT